MPFLLVDLGALAAGLLCLLAAIALTYIVKAIASALPNVSILGFGLNLAKIFRDAGDSIVSWVVDNTKDLWQAVEHWVSGHAYLLDSAFGAVVQAVSHLGDQVAHIVTDVVPNAISATESYVGRELVTLKNGIETDIHKAVTNATNLVEGDIKSLADQVSSDVTTVENDITKGITKAVSTAENYTDSAISDMTRYVDNAIAGAEQLAANALATAKSQIGTAIASVASTAANDLSSAENTLENQIAAAASTAAAATAQVASSLGSEITGAEQELQGQIGQAVNTLDTDIAGVEQTFSGDLSNLQTMLQAAIAASIAGVVARVAKLEQCSVGVCSDSPNNFSNLLQDALGLLSVVGAGSFLVQIIDSPKQAEDDYAAAIGGMFTAGQDLLSTIETALG